MNELFPPIRRKSLINIKLKERFIVPLNTNYVIINLGNDDDNNNNNNVYISKRIAYMHNTFITSLRNPYIRPAVKGRFSS